MDDAPYVDYHEIFPTRWEITAAYAICCAKCHVTKLAKYFRQRVPKDELYDKGYTGMDQARLPRYLRGDRVITKESKYCTQCQKTGHYRPTQMTETEIYESAHNGQVSLARANADVAKKRKRTAQKIGAAASERWERLKETPWLHIQAKISVELEYVRSALQYYKNRVKHYVESEDLAAFLPHVRDVMHAAASKCALDARAQRTVDKDLTWRTLIGDPAMRRLMALWEEIPSDQRSRMRRLPAPLNIVMRDEPLFADYVAPGSRPISERHQEIAKIIREQAAKRE